MPKHHLWLRWLAGHSHQSIPRHPHHFFSASPPSPWAILPLSPFNFSTLYLFTIWCWTAWFQDFWWSHRWHLFESCPSQQQGMTQSCCPSSLACQGQATGGAWHGGAQLPSVKQAHDWLYPDQTKRFSEVVAGGVSMSSAGSGFYFILFYFLQF